MIIPDNIIAGKPPKTLLLIDEGPEEPIEILVSKDKFWTVQIWNRLEEDFPTKKEAEKFIRSWLKNEMKMYERVAKKIRKVLEA